jgi:Fe-S-cluster-containing hydrogenase component 2
MKAHHGYEDGSGSFYLTVDTELCTGCEECVKVCPAAVLVMAEDDPVEENLVAAVAGGKRKQLAQACNPCKPRGYQALPCVSACAASALSHSW